LRFWPERLTWRGRRELPLKVWNMLRDAPALFAAVTYESDLCVSKHAGQRRDWAESLDS
jgi:hypothetical protein